MKQVEFSWILKHFWTKIEISWAFFITLTKADNANKNQHVFFLAMFCHFAVNICFTLFRFLLKKWWVTWVNQRTKPHPYHLCLRWNPTPLRAPWERSLITTQSLLDPSKWPLLMKWCSTRNLHINHCAIVSAVVRQR